MSLLSSTPAATPAGVPSAGVPAGDAPAAQAPAAPPPVTDERWRAALHAVLRRPELLALHAQPIAELTTGAVAGYEALSRFDGSRITAAPDRWFAAAEHWGVNAELQSRVLGLGLLMRSALPADTFLTVNVDPHLLTDERVSGVLLEQADLSRLVLELTEHTLAQDPVQLTAVLDALRSRGAMIAMDDAGTGYAGLSQLLALRPDIVKLDRELISGIDADPVRRALAEVLGDLVGRMDGWVLAEGIETTGELDAVVSLGLALGQGWALARPSSQLLTDLDDAVVGRIRAGAGRHRFTEAVISIVRDTRTGSDPAACEVLLGDDGRVRAVRWGGTSPQDPVRWSPALVVAPSASLPEVARRAATRHASDVTAPLVCTDGQGAVVGIVTHADLLLALARSS
ncbi:EAL domain-containing protein [Kineococcus rubinsiae]|uniref:EAL domain-containing protein n=1 Tax=Kineococcus rubinsiae TaxID=2609562 RepID=UPI001431A3FC|nr:EAL domain-containing protein [Kineococcus rubinsiae]NIZ93253.1 EAL domain-containing protein [Kineococcus rubinsiae]